MKYTVYYKDEIFGICHEVYLGTTKSGKRHWMIEKFENIEDSEKTAKTRFEKDNTEWVEIRNGKKVVKRLEK